MNRHSLNVTAKAEKRAVDVLDRSQDSSVVPLLGASGDNVSCRACIIHAARLTVLPCGGDAAVTEDLGQVEEIPTIAGWSQQMMTVKCGAEPDSCHAYLTPSRAKSR